MVDDDKVIADRIETIAVEAAGAAGVVRGRGHLLIEDAVAEALGERHLGDGFGQPHLKATEPPKGQRSQAIGRILLVQGHLRRSPIADMART